MPGDLGLTDSVPKLLNRANFEPKKGKYELVEMDADNQPAASAPAKKKRNVGGDSTRDLMRNDPRIVWWLGAVRACFYRWVIGLICCSPTIEDVLSQGIPSKSACWTQRRKISWSGS